MPMFLLANLEQEMKGNMASSSECPASGGRLMAAFSLYTP